MNIYLLFDCIRSYLQYTGFLKWCMGSGFSRHLDISLAVALKFICPTTA